MANREVIQVARKLYHEINPNTVFKEPPSFVFEKVEKANERRIKAKSSLSLYEWCKKEMKK